MANLQKLEEAHLQFHTKGPELEAMQTDIRKLKEEAAVKHQTSQQRDRAELTQLRSENRELKTARKQIPAKDLEFGHVPGRPIDFTEC